MTYPRCAVIGDNELYGHPARRHRRRPAKEGVPVSVADLNPEDYLVHAHHGIGQYLGLDHIVVEVVGRDFMQLAYAGGDRLYVPVDQMHLVRDFQCLCGVTPNNFLDLSGDIQPWSLAARTTLEFR